MSLIDGAHLEAKREECIDDIVMLYVLFTTAELTVR
jgi:hypothetical protein